MEKEKDPDQSLTDLLKPDPRFNVKPDDPFFKFVDERMRTFKPYFNIKPAEEERLEVANKDTDIITLNVGGRVFQTYRETACRSPVLARIVDPDAYGWSQDVKKDDKGHPFIDRCPDTFVHVLRLLREPSYQFPPFLESELLYYGIGSNEEGENERKVILQVDGASEDGRRREEVRSNLLEDLFPKLPEMNENLASLYSEMGLSAPVLNLVAYSLGPSDLKSTAWRANDDVHRRFDVGRI